MPSEIKVITLHYLIDVNCYLVKTGDGYILIDTGFSTERAGLKRGLKARAASLGTSSLSF